MQENRGGRPDAARPAVDALESTFWSEIAKKLKQYHPPNQKKKKETRTNIEQTQKGLQNEAGLDSQSNQKSMPKQVSKKIMEIMKINVFLICKNMLTQYKTIVFKVLKFACANGKGIKNTSTLTPKSILKSIQNRCESNAQKR